MNFVDLLSKYRSTLMGAAILWIIFFHFPLFKNVPIISSVIAHGYAGVDMFLFLSGMGLYSSMRKNENNIGAYYKNRFCRIFPEYWVILLIPIFTGEFGMNNSISVLCCITTIGYWIHNASLFWYISCITIFYIIFPLYYKFLNKYGLRVSLVCIIIGILLMIFYAFVVYYKLFNINIELIYTFARIPIFIIGSIFGYFMYENKKLQLSFQIHIVLFALFIVSIGFLCLSEKYLSEYLMTASLYFIPFIVITPILCVGLTYIFQLLPQVVIRSLSYIGTISLELYLFHPYVFLKIFKDGLFKNPIMDYMLSWLLTFLGAFLLYILNKYVLKRVAEALFSLFNISVVQDRDNDHIRQDQES